MSRPKRVKIENEMLSEPKMYSDEDIKQFLNNFQNETGVKFYKHVLNEIFTATVKTKIFFLSTLILLLTEKIENFPEDAKDFFAEISTLDKEKYIYQITFLIRELSKEIDDFNFDD
ncbi:hypothetical protein [Pseudomonas putida]|jgi:hypothetical protein|uniref:Uncharacterized protein n=1 Tax=Pseudomonas putida (strain W619) TaxID=390235 RepID=B1J376_PSEPW|nr:hypothetical protein [Pseudomonas putida]QQE84908.1 hypothetical protein JET17_04230 [Pseudomonas putida]